MRDEVLGRYRRTQPVVLGAEIAVLAALLAAWAALSPAGLGVDDWQGLLSAAIPAGIAAMAQTFPIVAGGQGLSAGATLLLATVVVARVPMDGPAGAWAGIAAGLACGVVIGGFNGLLTGFFRMRSTPVTLASGAVAGALALQLAGEDYTAAPPPLRALLHGWHAGGLAMVPLLTVLGLCLAASLLLASRAGQALRLAGAGAAVPGRAWLVFGAYVAAGLGAGIGGVFLAASYGAVNAGLGAPVLLQILAAVALGGSIPGLRGGSALGSLLGMLIVVAAGNLFVPLELPEFLSTAFDAGWLLLGFLICLATQRRALTGPVPREGAPVRAGWRPAAGLAVLSPLALLLANWLPASADLATIAAGMLLLAAGQAAALRGGTVDLSMPGLIGLGAIGTVALTGGHDARLLPVAGGLLLVAVAVGALHGVIAGHLRRAAIAVSLASAGLAQAASAGCLVLLPAGFAPPRLTAAMGARWLGVAPSAWLLAGLAVAVALGMDRLAKRSSPMAVALCGTMASAGAAVAFGIMLAGYGGSAHFSLVDSYFLPTIAAALLANSRAETPHVPVSRVLPIALLILLTDSVLLTLGASYAGRIGAVSALLVLGEALHARSARRGSGRSVAV